MPFVIAFLATYAAGALLLINAGQPNATIYSALVKVLGPQVGLGLALLFVGAPLLGMMVGGAVAARSAARDQSEGSLNPHGFFFGFFFGFATAWFVTFPLGLWLICGSAKIEDLLRLIGGGNMFLLGGVIPAVSLWIGVKVQTALTQTSSW